VPPDSADATILAVTAPSAPFLVPEVTLYLVSPEHPLWTATPEQAEAQGLPMPYWAFAWPGGQALARYLLDTPEVVRGKTVLDFGCGGGVEGIAAGKAGAKRVVCADVDRLAVQAAVLNAALNGVTVEPVIEDLTGTDGGWDVVLVGDVLYDPVFAARTLEWLKGLAERGATVLLGDPGRVPLDVEVDELGAYDAPHDGDPRGSTRWRTRVLRLGGHQ